MKLLALALANDHERFIKGYPPKGANLLMAPNTEICQLASLISKSDELLYLDERIDSISFDTPFDLALIFSTFEHEKRVLELVQQLKEKSKRSVLFGPLPTSWQNHLPDWIDSMVNGSILNAYSEIREDLSHGVLKKQYIAGAQLSYVPPNHVFNEKNNLFNKRAQYLQAIIGCFCLLQLKTHCSQNLYYGNNILKRDLIEVIGEVISLPYKHITLLDEDIAIDPDYYHEFFVNAWNYRKQWTVRASRRLFDHPGFIRLLAKAGTRIIFLNEDWFPPLFPGVLNGEKQPFQNELSNTQRVLREKRRQVKMLHSERMLVGAKLSLLYYPASQFNFDVAFKIIDRLDLDFLEIKFYAPAPLKTNKMDSEIEPSQRHYFPMIPTTDPAWLKNRFYALGHIIYRTCTRPLTLGFYNTLFYLIPYSLAYRQNYLEGIAYPP
jgi:hypothetical protein